jgi:hypothetical protein
MKKTSFGGVGTEILMFKTKFETEVDRVDALMAQISEQNEVIASLYGSLAKIFAGDLEKLANANDLTKSLISCKALLCKANVEIGELKKLMAECEEAQERAQRSTPDFAMYATNGREDVVPGRTFFMASKDASAAPFVMPSGQKPAIPAVSLSDVQLARRFSQQ